LWEKQRKFGVFVYWLGRRVLNAKEADRNRYTLPLRYQEFYMACRCYLLVMMKFMAIAGVLTLATSAHADTKVDPCGAPIKKKVKKRKRTPPPTPVKVETPPALPCHCEAPASNYVCKTGEKGDRGDPGVTTVVYRERRAKPALRLRAGVMGTIQGEHGDWAWGPALQLATDLSDKYELTFSAGLAVGVGYERESGHMLSLSVERRMDEAFGLMVGLNATEIEGSDDNGNIGGEYLGGHFGGVIHFGNVRTELALTLGRLEDDFEDGSQLAVGMQASAFYGFTW
jgi:hypothetical protein